MKKGISLFFKTFLSLLLILTSTNVNAQVSMANIFKSGMVLQRDADIPVWGNSEAQDTVFVHLDGKSAFAIPDDRGKWKTALPSLSAGGPYNMTVSDANNTIDLSDVYIGDVWLAAGQSNMEWPLVNSDNSAGEITNANDQMIREFKVSRGLSSELADDLIGGSWSPATSNNVGNFSAVGYYFAKHLKTEIGVPIGIINSSYGGSRIEAWMSEEMLGYDEEVAVLQNGIPERQPTVIYNSMLHPLLGYAIKGAIWYQAESNGDSMEDALAYGNLFKKMISSWRENWGIGDFPFIWVQLPNQGGEATESEPNAWDAWPQLRAGQSRSLSLPNTGEATTIDVGEVDIHPTNKIPVGNRLALVARKLVYGEDIAYSGPRYKSHTFSGDTTVIDFDHVGGGLVGDENDLVKWFSLGNNGGSLVQANAKIKGDQILVWSDQITTPSFLRYAWEYNPIGVNFYNTDGLPAVPFYLNFEHPGFSIEEFSASTTTVERGNRVILNWQVYGASSININDEIVDSLSSKQLYPTADTILTLTATMTGEVPVTDTRTINITVIDPQPTISISTDLGQTLEPNSVVTIVADANAPGGGEVAQVEFFIDGSSYLIDSDAPFEASWTPTENGDYILTAIVTDGNGNTTTSSNYPVTVTDLKLLTYEAEDAIIAGGTVQSNDQASGGLYADLQDGFTLTFDNVDIPEAGSYSMTVRYLLNYQSPKSQDLYVNGNLVEQTTFEAPDNTTWQTYRLNVDFIKGINTVEYRGVWNWMSFDNISIAIENSTSNQNRMIDVKTLVASPNPFSSSLNIEYFIPQSDVVQMELYDVSGKKVAKIINEKVPTGTNNLQFIGADLKNGVYLLMMRYKSQEISKKVVFSGH